MTTPTFLSINQLAQRQPALTVGGLRHWIFNEEKTDLKTVARLSELVKR